MKKEKNARKTVDLLSGSIMEALAKLALPIMGSSLIQTAYNLVDMFWISSLGPLSVAAVGSGGMFLWFSEAFMLFAKTGGQVLTGQSLGRNRRDEAASFASASLQLGLLLGILYALAMIVFRGPLVGIFHFTEQKTIIESEIYLAVVAFGIPINYLTKILTSLFAAEGDTKISFHTTTIGLVLNIILDPVFILTLRMGVFGAALATVLSQAVVLFIFLLRAKGHDLYRLKNLVAKHRLNTYTSILKIGLPSGFQTMFYSGISILLSRLVTSFGDTAVAAQRIGSQMESITWMSAEGFSIAINAFISQNFGASKWERTKKGYYAVLKLVCSVALVSTILFAVFPEFIMGLFFRDSASLTAGVSYLRIMAVSQICMCIEITTVGAFAGFGKTVMTFFLVSGLTVLRLPLAYVLAETPLGLDGVWWAITISSVLKGLILLYLFRRFLKKTMRIHKPECA